jgi:hypothetical protein
MSEGSKRRGGRPKGSKNKPKANGAETPAVGAAVKAVVEKVPQNEEERQATFYRHTGEYEKALEKKKAADAAFKNVCKIIKTEGIQIEDIKTAISLKDPAGSAILRDLIERQLRVARWMNAPVGTQFSMLDEVDRTPIDERAYEAGKRAGLAGDPATPPRSYTGELITKWTEGFNEGNAVLAQGIKEKNAAQRAQDADEFDQVSE